MRAYPYNTYKNYNNIYISHCYVLGGIKLLMSCAMRFYSIDVRYKHINNAAVVRKNASCPMNYIKLH